MEKYYIWNTDVEGWIKERRGEQLMGAEELSDAGRFTPGEAGFIAEKSYYKLVLIPVSAIEGEKKEPEIPSRDYELTIISRSNTSDLTSSFARRNIPDSRIREISRAVKDLFLNL